MAGFQTTRHASTQTFSRREKSFRLSLIRAKRVYAVLHYVTGSLMSVCSLVLYDWQSDDADRNGTGTGATFSFRGILCWVSV